MLREKLEQKKEQPIQSTNAARPTLLSGDDYDFDPQDKRNSVQPIMSAREVN